MMIRKLCLLASLMMLQQAAPAKAVDCNNDGIDDSLQLGGCIAYYDVDSTTGYLTIPDNNPFFGVGTVFDLLDSFTVCDVRVGLRISHEHNGDLQVRLRHEDTDTEVILVDRPGYPELPAGYDSSGYSIFLDDDAQQSIEIADVGEDNPIEGIYSPHPGSLADFLNHNTQRYWRIETRDVATGNIGTLDSWGLYLENYDPRGNDCNLNDVPDDCETDTDGDGTPDDCDACPNDRNKTDPGICGCGIWDRDTDRDDTPDCNDLCPEDETKTDPGVCGCGIPDADTDGDGTPDCIDDCPIQ